MARNLAFYKHIIRNMPAGLIMLGDDDIITVCNRAAVEILGVVLSDVLNRPFGSAFQTTNDINAEFVNAVLQAARAPKTGNEPIVEFRRPDATTVMLSITGASLKDKRDEHWIGTVITLNDITTLIKNQKRERTLNRELSRAMVKAKGANRQLKETGRKSWPARLGITLIILMGFVAGGVYVWHLDLLPGKSRFTGKHQHAIRRALEYTPHQVTRRPLSAAVSLTGVVAPLEELNILAPFEGRVKEMFFSYDQKVERNDRLLTMDTTPLERELREKQSAYIKARQAYNDLVNWQDNIEMARARRSFLKAQARLDTTKRRFEESKQLFDKGIIAAAELEMAEHSYFYQKLDFKAVQEEMEVVAAKGNPEQINMARLDLENARSAFKDVETRLKRGVVCAPVPGVIMRPPATGSSHTALIEPGVSVSQGGKLFSIGNLNGCSIKARADEIDIGKIKLGQTVTVHGDAFADMPLKGCITHISANAVTTNLRNPEFDVTITVDALTSAQKRKIHLGMTANLTVTVYENPSALVVPLPAVEIRQGKKWVTVRDKESDDYQKVEVKTGITTMDAVEILDGLAVSDTVYLTHDGYGTSNP